MRWQSKENRRLEKGWHETFAWLPIEYETGKWIWMEKLEINYYWSNSICTEDVLVPEYRLINNFTE